MALEKSGVILVAEQYEQYMNQMRNINMAHQQAFGDTRTQQAYRQQMSQTSGALGSLGSAANAATSALRVLKGLFAAFMAIKIVQQFLNFAKAATQVAMRAETLKVSLYQVGETAGYTAKQIEYAEHLVKKQGITTIAARQALMRLAQANIDFAHASKLARIAQDAAVIGNINSSQAFQRMIYGIQSGQLQTLRTIGINVSFQRSYKELADQLNKNVKDLTEYEKAQARVNAVIRSGESIAGAYEAAMGTAGKQQLSLARHIEETQLALGKILLPLSQAKVQFDTMKWKGLREVAVGLQLIGPILTKMIEGLKGVSGALLDVLRGGANFITTWKESENVFTRLGSGMHNFLRIGVAAFTTLPAYVVAFRVIIKGLIEDIQQIGYDLSAIARGDFSSLTGTGGSGGGFGNFQATMGQGPAEWKVAFTEQWHKSLQRAMDAIPALNKSFDELVTETMEAVDMQRNFGDQLGDTTADIEAQEDALKALTSAVSRVEDIYETWTDGIEKANRRLSEGMAKLATDTIEKQAAALDRYTTQMRDIESSYQSKRAELIYNTNQSIMIATRNFHNSLERERVRHQMRMEQSLRRFKLQERWLMAEGDVLGLMRAREEFALSQTEAEEEDVLRRRESREGFNIQIHDMKQQLSERLAVLKEDTQRRKAEATKSYQNELVEIEKYNTKRKKEMEDAYEQQLTDLIDARDDQLRKLAESLRDEGRITEEGMRTIADLIGDVYGPGGASDVFITGWAARTENKIYQAVQRIQAQMARLASMQVPSPTPMPWPYTPSTPQQPFSYTGGGSSPTPMPWPMRAGGTGLVTGPALFAVEPGVREIVSLVPMGAGRSSRSSLDVSVAGGIDIRGAGGASPGIIDASVEMVMREIGAAAESVGR